MNKRFYAGGVLKVELPDKILLLLSPERPASSRSKRAFSEDTWQEVKPPASGYAEGVIGCQEAIIVLKAINKRAPAETKQLQLIQESP